jgi:hypothetical protein
MRERHFGRIVNISSINGQAGQFGQTNYAAAKAGGFAPAPQLLGVRTLYTTREQDTLLDVDATAHDPNDRRVGCR